MARRTSYSARQPLSAGFDHPKQMNHFSPSDAGMSLAHRALMLGLALVVGACTTYGTVENQPLLPGDARPG